VLRGSRHAKEVSSPEPAGAVYCHVEVGDLGGCRTDHWLRQCVNIEYRLIRCPLAHIIVVPTHAADGTLRCSFILCLASDRILGIWHH
jgi:hypothetical protein